jgi:hypothetical protein
MKRFFILCILTFCIASARSQGFSNFFSQKEADIKYMLQQIAALQVYIGYAEKGYSIAEKGLHFIGELKKGEYDLHSAFFSSLSLVNPNISKYTKVADIITYQLAIISGLKKIIQVKNMSPAEMSYLQTVSANMSAACKKSLNALINLLTDGTYQMTDNERITRIDALYADMKDKYAFTQSFGSSANLLAAQRQNELDQIQFLKTVE